LDAGCQQTFMITATWNLNLFVGVTRAMVDIARRAAMNGLIYLVGLIVVIMFILSFLGLR
jgi:hypothetical protein